WPPRVEPPKGAPNILLIMTDDTGFGAPSTFGGVIPTPALDRIAANGLRYTNFHSTALCSPTRAAIITGRNHHSSGFGVVAEQATGYPGYDSIITRDKTGAVTQDPAGLPWELYDLSTDWTQYDDVANKHPSKLKELQNLFWAEAAKYQVLPLDASVATRLITPKPSLTAGRTVFTWSGQMTGTPNGDAPNILDASYNFRVEV